MLKLWNLTLVILTFSLTLFGTFLTRSGIIASVHAFSQGTVGIFFLGFLTLVVVGSLALLAWRWDVLKSTGELDSVVSRESAFLLNNVLLVAAGFTVFFGTVFPLLSEAIRGVKARRRAFFNQVKVPLFVAIFLMGWAPDRVEPAVGGTLRRNFVWPVVRGIAAAPFFFPHSGRSAGVLPRVTSSWRTITLAFSGHRAPCVTANRPALHGGRPRRTALRRLHSHSDPGHRRRHGSRRGGQTRRTLRRGEAPQLAGYKVRFDGLRPTRSEHFGVVGTSP